MFLAVALTKGDLQGATSLNLKEINPHDCDIFLPFSSYVALLVLSDFHLKVVFADGHFIFAIIIVFVAIMLVLAITILAVSVLLVASIAISIAVLPFLVITFVTMAPVLTLEEKCFYPFNQILWRHLNFEKKKTPSSNNARNYFHLLQSVWQQPLHPVLLLRDRVQ